MNKLKISIAVIFVNLSISGLAMAIDWNNPGAIPPAETKTYFFCLPCII